MGINTLRQQPPCCMGGQCRPVTPGYTGVGTMWGCTHKQHRSWQLGKSKGFGRPGNRRRVMIQSGDLSEYEYA